MSCYDVEFCFSPSASKLFNFLVRHIVQNGNGWGFNLDGKASTQNKSTQKWTEDWLRCLSMLQRQSAIITDEWHQLHSSELTVAVDREKLSMISHFYSGRELQ